MAVTHYFFSAHTVFSFSNYLFNRGNLVGNLQYPIRDLSKVEPGWLEKDVDPALPLCQRSELKINRKRTQRTQLHRGGWILVLLASLCVCGIYWGFPAFS